MDARPGRGPALRAGLVLAFLAVSLGQGAAVAASGATGAPVGDAPRRAAGTLEQGRPPAARPRPAAPTARAPAPPSAPRPVVPRAYLIHLVDGGDPIVVSAYTQERGEIVFEKYGGLVRIPTYEVLRIVPDLPDPAERTANLPPSPVSPETGGAPLRPEPDLYVGLRGGGSLRASALEPDGDRVRVSVADGSFTVARSELVSVVRVPPGAESPEAWLSILVTEPDDPAADAASAGLLPDGRPVRLPYRSSDRPHFLRLTNGQLLRVEGFWVEDGEFRFERLGGVVGVALGEVARLFPEEIAPVRGRTPVRFARRLAPDLAEVSVRSGLHRVRLVGIEPVAGTWTADDPWRRLERGLTVYLEFDRQRYDAEGNWLAYLFMPDGRMLNAELVRLGLARPVNDGRNVRYLDLLHELAAADSRTGMPAGR